MSTEALLTCYNKGCGQKFNPSDNDEGKNKEFSFKDLSRKLFSFSHFFVEKCTFHPGNPIFHDAYKGWSCCNKKSTDFTEFLNFQGCSKGKHSNEKPVEPEKPKTILDIDIEKKITERRIEVEPVTRPSFESKCTHLEPYVNPPFKQQMDQMDMTKKMQTASIDGSVPIGTSCKNGGCRSSYESTESNDRSCVYHPGVPIFHEGLKFWSCCQRKTSDFQSFLEQAGCETGKHKWIQEEASNKVNCRWDWHQTPTNVVVAVYAKSYDYKKSFVKINPVRLMVKIIFPKENNAEFNIDIELRGIIDVSRASASMYGTKIEITLPKAQAGHWTKLDYPKDAVKEEEPKEIKQENESKKVKAEIIETANDESDSDVDLDDLEIVSGAKITELASEKVDVD